MVTCRIAVKMAAPSAPREDHNALTEWVNVIAFTERTRHLLMQCEKGMLVAISRNVTKEFYQSRSGEREISRTIIVEDILSTAGSLQPEVAHPADMDHEIKTTAHRSRARGRALARRRAARPRLIESAKTRGIKEELEAGRAGSAPRIRAGKRRDPMTTQRENDPEKSRGAPTADRPA